MPLLYWIIFFNDSTLLAEQNRGDTSTDLQSSTNTTQDCGGGYYLSESGVCRPLCSLWTEPAKIDADYIGIIAAVIICLPSSLVLITVALIFQRKSMCVRIITLLDTVTPRMFYSDVHYYRSPSDYLLILQVNIPNILLDILMHYSNPHR